MVANYNDGGRSTSSHSTERWDCAVRSLAIVLGLPYDDVHRHFRMHGRSFQDGVTTKQYERVLDELCPMAHKRWVPVQLNIGEIGHKWATQRILKVYENDTIVMDTYVEFRGEKFAHLCAVVKGVIQDLFLPYNQIVKRVYLICNAD